MIYEIALVAPAMLALCFVLLHYSSQDEARRFMYSIAAIFSMFVLAGMTILFLSSSETLSVYNPPANIVITNASSSGNVVIVQEGYYSNTIYPAFTVGVQQANGLLMLVEVVLVLLVVFLFIDLLLIKPWQRRKGKR
jgi:hypothetical protein